MDPQDIELGKALTGEADLSGLSFTDQQRLEAVLRDGWRFTPATMAQKITNGRWIPARHLLHISTIVARAVAAGNARIILTMPARHGKSEFLSVNTPIWFLEKNPDKYVMNISYGSELATDFSFKVRETFQNEDLHHLLRARVKKDKQRVDRFLMSGGGGLTAAGIGGPLTGRGADLMLIDDYIKNAEESMSETKRAKDWEWFKSTAYTRLEPNASLIILATRWNINDLIGMCLKEMPEENWEVINLPALAEINDPLGRAVGEPLWPERYSLEALLRIKKALGTYWWSAMYQQRPKSSMAGLDLSDYLKYCDPLDLPHDLTLTRIRAWDLAASDVAKADWTAGPRMAYHAESDTVFIEDMKRFQKGPHTTEDIIESTADDDGHGIRIAMEQEPGSSGKIVISHYAGVLKSYAFEGEKATGPIEVRATPFLSAVEDGRVVLVRGDWNKEFESELDAFPDGEHDDQIVATALGFNKLVKGKGLSVVWGRHGRDKNVISIEEARRKVRRDTEQPRTGVVFGRR